MVPEKKAVARRSGLRGHHSTWNAQLSAEGSYSADGVSMIITPISDQIFSK